MKTYRLSHQARQDLYDITDYIAERNPSAAERVLHALRETFSILAAQPGIGLRRDDLCEDLHIHPGERPANQYVICYYVTDAGIEISDIIHGARDWEGMFTRDER